VPFTPYHFGPGVLAKAVAPRRFSLTAYVVTQVAIDCETLYHIVTHTRPDHRFFHTMVGASLVGWSMAVGIAIVAPWVTGRWRGLEEDLSWMTLWVGGWSGGLAHAILDSMYHRDAMPFWPWSRANPLLSPHHVAPEICLATGIAGLAIVAWRMVRQ
jgi:membrane-bound metal-dependent hydrolase YbcI (DUF457 family)